MPSELETDIDWTEEDCAGADVVVLEIALTLEDGVNVEVVLVEKDSVWVDSTTDVEGGIAEEDDAILELEVDWVFSYSELDDSKVIIVETYDAEEEEDGNEE